jgi:hypothetical protein
MMRRAVVRGCVSVEVNSKARPVAPAVRIESTSQSAIRALPLGDCQATTSTSVGRP